MGQERLYSSWLATVLLILIAWLAAGPQGPSVSQAPPGSSAHDSASSEAGILSGKKIIIDPGHGGHNASLGDLGTVGVGPTVEKENVLQVALRLRNLLEQAGAEVVMTRTEDVNPAMGTVYEHVPSGQLLARVEKARSEGGDAFISIHNDWHPDPNITGTTTYYYHPHSSALADSVHNSLVDARGSVDRGVRQKAFMVIRDVPIPSILVEVGYLSNHKEAHELADPVLQDRTADGLYTGLVQYFKAM